MECFDISHISGTFVVASMVHFANGRPDKNEYRRFQIKSFIGNDDYRAMQEVVGRRYRRQDEAGTPFCVTFDFESEKDESVTIRDRDTMEQERVSLDRLEGYLAERLIGA